MKRGSLTIRRAQVTVPIDYHAQTVEQYVAAYIDQGRRAFWQLKSPLFAIRSVVQKMTAKKSSLSRLKVAVGASTTKVPAKKSFQSFRPARSN
ncbi:hypothetical protein PQR02_29100 [Paraburkholderia sediminicola]|uniref:Uncharacterized protein n=1 Tax=Paraburkholderia rhynchosiae TaxID=487049 RepID=A0ACC7NJ96_9BURK